MNFRETLEAIEMAHTVAIAGLPNAGKTFITDRASEHYKFHTDDFVHQYDWLSLPQGVIDAIGDKDQWLVEGMQVPRLLKRGLKPELVVWMDNPKVRLSPKQAGLGRQMWKAFEDWSHHNEFSAVIFCED